MEKVRARLKLSFSTKVLVPVVTIMVLLLAITVWTVNHRLTQQFQVEASRSLQRADVEFRNAQKGRTKNLVQRLRNLRNEPRYKEVIQSGQLPTLVEEFQKLPADQSVDVVLFTSAQRKVMFGVKGDPEISINEFERSSVIAVDRALQNEEIVDTIRAGDQLFDVVSIPVADASGAVLGALTFGSELRSADVNEFSLSSQSEIVLLADDRVIAATLPADPQHNFIELFKKCAVESSPGNSFAPIKIFLGGEHYLCLAGRFSSLGDDGNPGYLLLFSYEQPLRALQSTQQMLLLVSGLGILAGTGIVWLLVRKVTRPLRALRDSAEAVGRGDFSRRVQVYSRDEYGELADVFNQMTENLKSSREQLEMTVETLRTTQAQLIQSEKLSGIGEFVAGVAHELNNPLTSVMGFSELLKKSDTNPQHLRYLEMIYKSSLRCQKIVQSLLSFARRHQPERKLSSVNELLEAALEILQYQMRTSNIEVTTQLDASLPKAMLDPHQVQQVFINIINNARQAIEAHRPHGWVRLTTEHDEGHARVIIEDNGPGIAETNLSKVFDPFFTTKDVGKGTGLGLSLCYGIIKEHGGHITVRSKPGAGSSFIIELPLGSELATNEAAEPNGTNGLPSVPNLTTSLREGVGKRVLVIDDEEAILHMVSEALTEHGYQVDLALDGETGLQRLNQTAYDLTLCDWKMPGLNGQEVYERLRISNPSLSERMIFLTGDVINEKTQRFLQECNKICLTKPFSLDEFRSAVSQAMAV
jgi:two-component system NtrC family sensor kinase